MIKSENQISGKIKTMGPQAQRTIKKKSGKKVDKAKRNPSEKWRNQAEKETIENKSQKVSKNPCKSSEVPL
ncbi:hypothetical protein [Peptoniphilus sp. EMRHCC_23]|uniref:hypothetical protein n=1 Tax=Peptoniphilus rachelemmaiella TaxID=2811779 RepID=UPI001C005548|nr:hypothetical protein [Peptoniphilus rachelemmaiella]